MTESIRVATWNVWWRFGPWEQRAELLARELARLDADVVCLQEVHAEVGDRSDPPPGQVNVDVDADPATSQAAALARACGMAWSAHSWRFAQEGVSFGNAILARTAPDTVAAAPLDSLDGRFEEHRSVLAATLTTPGGNEVVVASSHLNFMWDQSAVRQAQVDGIMRFLADRRPTGAVTILTGDLNAVPDSEEVATLTGRRATPTPGLAFVDAWEAAGTHAGHTWSHANGHAATQAEPDRRIDYVLASFPGHDNRGRVLAADRFGTDARAGVHPSDHFGVVATIELDGLPRHPDEDG